MTIPAPEWPSFLCDDFEVAWGRRENGAGAAAAREQQRNSQPLRAGGDRHQAQCVARLVFKSSEKTQEGGMNALLDRFGSALVRSMINKSLICLASQETPSWNTLLSTLKMLDSLRQSFTSIRNKGFMELIRLKFPFRLYIPIGYGTGV